MLFILFNFCLLAFYFFGHIFQIEDLSDSFKENGNLEEASDSQRCLDERSLQHAEWQAHHSDKFAVDLSRSKVVSDY